MKTEVVTLMKNGQWDEEGTATLADVPGAGEKPATGYKEGSWDENMAQFVISRDSKHEFTYTYAKDEGQQKTLTYTVEYYVDDVHQENDDQTVTEKVWINSTQTTLTVDKDAINTTNKYGDEYTLDYTEPGTIPDTIETDSTIKVYYSSDTHSTDPNNPDSSDGIPDKYQARVDYVVSNGTFDFGYTYVTLFDENGNWSETGKGTLEAAQIPTATANAGYDQSSFAWQGNTPVAGYEITGNTTFNALFNAIPVTPTPTPDGGGTTTPTTPGARTTDDGTTTDEPEVEEVEDEETPLSDGEVEEVEDNATPKSNNSIWALINLIAAIVTVILGLFLLLSKRHRNDEDEDEDERQARMARGEEKEQEQKRGWICKVLGVIVAIASVVFFILTEDMSLPMALTDKWTIWMIVIAIVELVLVLVGRHWKDVDDEDQEQQA